jgi:hypothetical protein
MTKWNYRVVRHNRGTDEEYFTIKEVYYNENNISYADRSATPFGTTIEELKEDLQLLTSALTRPILDFQRESGKLMELKDDQK